jgi:hypothetical protein
MTLGIDVSRLFTDMVMVISALCNIHSNSIGKIFAASFILITILSLLL